MADSQVTSSTKSKPKEKSKTRHVPLYHVILANDDYHTFEFVVDVLLKVLGCTKQKAFLLTEEAHKSGRAIIWTGSKEVAELKYEQVLGFHEIRGGTKLGPLGCTIEPVLG